MEQKLKVYLAGSMNYAWRGRVIGNCGTGFTYLNPMDHKLSKPNQYTVWDLLAVKHSDIVFAVMEDDNPSGYGLTLELGYSKALGKTVILCDLRSAIDPDFKKKFEIVRNAADILFEDFQDAIDYLKSFSRM